MDEFLKVFLMFTDKYGLEIAILLVLNILQCIGLVYLFREWRKDVSQFTEAAKAMSSASQLIETSIASLDKSLAEIRGALFAPVNRNGRGGQR